MRLVGGVQQKQQAWLCTKATTPPPVSLKTSLSFMVPSCFLIIIQFIQELTVEPLLYYFLARNLTECTSTPHANLLAPALHLLYLVCKKVVISFPKLSNCSFDIVFCTTVANGQKAEVNVLKHGLALHTVTSLKTLLPHVLFIGDKDGVFAY